jgi:hypothetical protein
MREETINDLIVAECNDPVFKKFFDEDNRKLKTAVAVRRLREEPIYYYR